MNRIKWIILFLIVFVGIQMTSFAQTGQEIYSGNLEILSVIRSEGRSVGLEASGDYLYVAEGGVGLGIIDISDPTRPKRVGRFYESPSIGAGKIVGVGVDGDTVYAAAKNGVYVLDASKAPSLRKIKRLSLGNNVLDVYVKNGKMYLSVGPFGMVAYDISDLDRPRKIAGFTIPDRIGAGVSGITVYNNRLYMASGQDGLFVLNLDENGIPIYPPERIRYSDRIDAKDLVIGDGKIYIANGRYGLTIRDMAKVTREIGSLNLGRSTGSEVAGVAVQGNIIFVSGGDSIYILRMKEKADTTPPTIKITEPSDGQEVSTQTVTVKGTARDESGIKEVTVNGEPAGKAIWTSEVTLKEGENTITITATDANGNTKTEKIKVTYAPAAPVLTPAPRETPVVTPTPEAQTPTPEPKKTPGFPVTFTLLALAVLGLRKAK